MTTENTMPDLSFEVTPVIAADITMADCMAIIKEAIASQKGSNEAIQKALVAACSVAFNTEYHKKNVAPFTSIVEGLRGTDRQTIVTWIKTHAPASWVEKDGKKRFQFNESFKGEFDSTALFADKWYDAVPSTKTLVDTIDFKEQLANFIKRMEREVKAGTKTISHLEVLKAVKETSAKLSVDAQQ